MLPSSPPSDFLLHPLPACSNPCTPISLTLPSLPPSCPSIPKETVICFFLPLVCFLFLSRCFFPMICHNTNYPVPAIYSDSAPHVHIHYGWCSKKKQTNLISHLFKKKRGLFLLNCMSEYFLPTGVKQLRKQNVTFWKL